MKKKFFAVFFALLVLCTAVVPVFADEAGDWDFSEEYPTAEPTGVTINVYNWGEYISNGTEGSLDVNAEFTRRTGIEVNYTTFDSNESLYSKLAGGGASYDVIVPSDYMISKLMNENMLAELDFSKPSVSVAMKNLREKEQIRVTPEGYIYLTDSGRAIAEMIYERHQLLSRGLMSLGVDEQTATEDACRIEHVISQESFEAIKRHLHMTAEK